MNASLFERLRYKCLGFLKDEKGAMAIFVAAGAVAFVGIAGISVDTARGYMLKSRLSSALDAAGLAGARVMFSPTRDAEILKYFSANIPDGYLGATVTAPVPPAVVPGQTTLALSASATIDTTLTRVLGINTLTVSAVTEITRATPSLDVVIAMDMSGSMKRDTAGVGGQPEATWRLTLAKDAAKLMTNILFSDPDNLDLNFGLVPWSKKVNVTDNNTAVDPTLTTEVLLTFTNPATGLSQDRYYYANNSPVPLLSSPPAPEPFTDTNGDGIRNSGEDYTDTNGNGKYDGWIGCVFARYTDDGINNDADMETGQIIGVGGLDDWPAWEIGTQQQCPGNGITPLQSTQIAIDNAINALTNPTGTTEMIAGLAWAWRVLVPSAPFTEAPPDPNNQRVKAIIFLTDGAYTRNSTDSYKRRLGVTEAQNRLRSLATKIKNTGVRIYTIQFATTSGVQLMKDVATEDTAPYYSNAASGAQLDEVFRKIADDLVELHISS